VPGELQLPARFLWAVLREGGASGVVADERGQGHRYGPQGSKEATGAQRRPESVVRSRTPPRPGKLSTAQPLSGVPKQSPGLAPPQGRGWQSTRSRKRAGWLLGPGASAR
jgi:hypothetical protein